MLRLAYFSPLNPRRSGISDYSEELLPHLARGAEIDLFVDGFKPSNPELLERFRWFDYHAKRDALSRLGDYDAVIYHLGNDHRYHAGIYEAARAFPGIVVLHDFALHTFFLGLARARENINIYLDELEACHGALVRAQAEEMLKRGGTTPAQAQAVLFPLNQRIVRNAEALIVHSEWSRSRLAVIAPSVPIAQINHHVLPEDTRRHSPPAQPERIEIASFGHITTEKGIERTLRVLAQLSRSFNFHYTLVGQPEGFDVSALVRAHGLSQRVTVTGYVSMEEFKERIRTCDIAVNLRERTVGETSGSVCRVMAAGVPAVVSNIGWFAELPGDAVLKVDPGENADAMLHAALHKLLEDASLRAQLGTNAKRFVAREFAIERSAQGYLTFIGEVVAQRTRRRFIRKVATEMSLMGILPADDGLLRGVSGEIARLIPTTLSQPEG
ncbi:MAG TPA: glycosyltransferase family 4 protein [Pyrinomonadaceae bacterium]|nr:glycosyltransferase family 4 protein [Pyrinomonadaceae bacterium]